MRAVLATAVAALALAAPAGAITIDKTAASTLRSASPIAIASTAKADKLHSCQAGDRRARAAPEVEPADARLDRQGDRRRALRHRLISRSWRWWSRLRPSSP